MNRRQMLPLVLSGEPKLAMLSKDCTKPESVDLGTPLGSIGLESRPPALWHESQQAFRSRGSTHVQV